MNYGCWWLCRHGEPCPSIELERAEYATQCTVVNYDGYHGNDGIVGLVLVLVL